MPEEKHPRILLEDLVAFKFSMNQENDISPEVKELILAHADEYLTVQENIEKILEWGERELDKEEARLKAADGTFGDFTDAAAKIDAEVKLKLAYLEKEIRSKYPVPEAEAAK